MCSSSVIASPFEDLLPVTKMPVRESESLRADVQIGGEPKVFYMSVNKLLIFSDTLSMDLS